MVSESLYLAKLHPSASSCLREKKPWERGCAPQFSSHGAVAGTVSWSLPVAIVVQPRFGNMLQNRTQGV